MIPLNNINIENGIEIVKQPSLTYKIKLNRNKIEQYINGKEAVKQSIYKILMTQRYKYLIYDWNYGIELEDLFGKPKTYVYAELQRRIEDALSADDRIENVYNFKFDKINNNDKTSVYVEFSVSTIFGKINIDWNLNIDETQT